MQKGKHRTTRHMTWSSAGLAAIAAVVSWGSTAWAQNALEGRSIHIHATFMNVGLAVDVSGDDNENGQARLEIDPDGNGYRAAHRLSRVSAGRFVGSALFLQPGQAFSVRVTLEDPDGVSNAVLEAEGRTRELSVPTGSGRVYHVAIDGSDSNDGSEQHPFATVSHAVQSAGPGDTVMIHAGTYHEEVHLPSGGNEQAPLTITSAGDGEVILDGADPDLKDAGAWSDEGGAVYSAQVDETRYVAVDGVRLWRYESRDDLDSLALGTDGGFFWSGGRVYVRLPGDAEPQGHEIQVSTLGRAFWLEGTPDVVISNLTIRCYGAEQYSQGIMVRDGSHRVWIVGNTFENVMPGVWIKNDVDDLTVWNNEFSDLGLAEFPWHEVKRQGGMESGAIAVDSSYDGQGIVFYQNTVHDSFDGLNVCGNEETTWPNDVDVVENTIYHLADDGMETDGDCSNIRILKNRFDGSLCGVSVAPASPGPIFVVRNLMVNLHNVAPDSDWMTRALKFNVGDSRITGEVFVYHNTGTTTEPDQASFAVTDDSKWTHVWLLNNIWTGTDFAFYYQNTGDEPFDQDYDLLYSTGSRLVAYQDGRYEDVDSYFAEQGQCEHCVEGDPLFVDAQGGDFSLDENSPALDKGLVIAGINEGFRGDGPDMGALERGGEVPPPPPDAGVRPDSGAIADGGSTTSDSGSADGSSSSGCGCRTGRAEGAGRCAVWLIWLAVGLLWQRRRIGRTGSR